MTVLDTAPPGTAPPGAPAAVLSVLTLTEPLPGFPGHRDYALVPAGSGTPVFWLQSVATDGPRFLVVRAAAFFPDYAPALPRALQTDLDVADLVQVELFCIVTVPDGDVRSATANLRAPLVVNHRQGRARQVVLPDATHPIRRPLRR